MPDGSRKSNSPPRTEPARIHQLWWFALTLSGLAHAAALFGIGYAGAPSAQVQPPRLAFRQGSSAATAVQVFIYEQKPQQVPEEPDEPGQPTPPEPGKSDAPEQLSPATPPIPEPSPQQEPADRKPPAPEPPMAESPQTEAPEVDLHELTDALAGRLREASRQATEWKENLGRQLAAAVSQAKAEQKQPAASDPAETEKPQETALRDPRPERTPPADETPSPDRDLPVKADETPPAAEQDAPEQNDAPGITSAEPLKPVVPQYPPACIRRGLEGLVVVEAQVGVGGKVTAARVVQPSGHRRLDRAAVRAVTEARFRPATRGGEPIASRVRVPVRFRLRRR